MSCISMTVLAMFYLRFLLLLLSKFSSSFRCNNSVQVSVPVSKRRVYIS